MATFSWPTVAATGHRPQHLSPEERRWAQEQIPGVVVRLRDVYGMTCGVSGMAAGFDLWWASALVDARVELWAHVPFPQQPDRWPAPEQAEWRRLLNVATAAGRVTRYGGAYDVRLLHERNDGMLQVSDAVVALWKRSHTTGGTASAVAKAERRGLPIVHMDPEQRSITLTFPEVRVGGPPLTNPENE